MSFKGHVRECGSVRNDLNDIILIVPSGSAYIDVIEKDRIRHALLHIWTKLSEYALTYKLL